MHVTFVGRLVFIPAEIQSEFVDDLGPLPDPIIPGLVGDVVLDPCADGAP